MRAFRRGYEQVARPPVARQRIDWFAANQVLCSEMYKLIKRMDVELMGKLVPLALRLSSQGR